MTLAIVLAMSLRPPTDGIPTSGISSTTAAKEARFLAAADAETGSVGGAASSRSSSIRAVEAVSKLSGIRVAVIAPNSPPV